MSQQQALRETQGARGGAAGAPPTLPDVNAETYPYEFVQYLLDETADFSIFAVPDPQHADAATLTPDSPQDFFGLNGGYGVSLRSILHHFDSLAQTPTAEAGIQVAQSVGEAAGSFSSRWLFCPEDCPWSPGQLPPPHIFDPYSSQRFSMLDCEFTLGEEDSFSGYGVGRTFPVAVRNLPQLLVGGVGNIMEGFGKFSGLNGTFVLTGTLTPSLGFLGHVSCRVVDPYGQMRREREISSSTAITDPDPRSSLIMLRGEKKDKSVKTTYGPPPGGDLVSLLTPSQMRAVQYGFTSRGGGGVHAERRIGQVVGNMDANVFFNLLAPPGTAQAPVPFTTEEVYSFMDDHGRTVGTLTAGVVEGISFSLRLPSAPGQPGVRFAGFGPITGGSGPFEGAQGMLTVNSLIGIAPHALSLMHVLHVSDPQGKFRAAARAGAH